MRGRKQNRRPHWCSTPTMRAAVALSLVSLAAALVCTSAIAQTNLPPGFVSVRDGRLVVGDECKEFYFAGWQGTVSYVQTPCSYLTSPANQEHVGSD